MPKNAIVSKAKLEELRGLEIIDEDMFEAYDKNIFESNRDGNTELMVNIGEKIVAEIGIDKDVERCILSADTIRQLKEIGLIKMDKINSKEVVFQDFPSKFNGQQKLLAFSRATETSLDDLLAKTDTHVAVADDGTVDLSASAGDGETGF